VLDVAMERFKMDIGKVCTYVETKGKLAGGVVVLAAGC